MWFIATVLHLYLPGSKRNVFSSCQKKIFMVNAERGGGGLTKVFELHELCQANLESFEMQINASLYISYSYK